MLPIYLNPDKEKWPELMQRPVMKQKKLRKTVKKILKRVKLEGDHALYDYTMELDQIELKELSVSKQEIEDACASVPEDLKNAILTARRNIEAFHIAQVESMAQVETMPGVSCWRSMQPVEKVGLYIPGGSAPLISTVLMLGVPAQIAGCKEVIIATPPMKNGGGIDPAILYTAFLCGIEKIFKVGGAQAIAAMAYGTETIPKVQKLFGPGNQYVTCAKELVQLDGVAIDMPAGPSELLVIADQTAVPKFVAADLLSQAEHGPDSQVILLTNETSLAEQVNTEIAAQIKEIPRSQIAETALSNSKAIILKDIEEMICFSNEYAPEHLMLSIEAAEKWSLKIRSAGSVFLGNYAPEAAGDYATGTNHALPTNGFAAMYSGISVDSFVKKISYQQLTPEGLRNVGPSSMLMAEAEGLHAHKNAIMVRLLEN